MCHTHTTGERLGQGKGNNFFVVYYMPQYSLSEWILLQVLNSSAELEASYIVLYKISYTEVNKKQ